MSLAQLLQRLVGKADEHPLLAEQERLLQKIDDIDSELASEESDLADAREALAEAQKDVARLDASVRGLQGKMDAAVGAWGAVSEKLTAAGIDEQYWLDGVGFISDYGKDNYT